MREATPGVPEGIEPGAWIPCSVCGRPDYADEMDWTDQGEPVCVDCQMAWAEEDER